MERALVKKYYQRKEIQEQFLLFAKDREIAIKFDSYFGKRPQVLENYADLEEAIKKGVTSFHSSEERWLNPLLLSNQNLSENDKNKNRLGWDLILDLDGVDFVYAKIVAKIILDFFDELGIKNSSIKFSGNKGFHIGVPFEAFSQNILGVGETRLLFPDVPKKIAAYLMHELKDKIIDAIHKETGTLEDIAKKYNFVDKNTLLEENGKLNFMKLIEIDTILITSRHLFRMPYSLNEKSGLVSIPIPKKKVMQFERYWAKPFNVKPELNKFNKFLAYNSDYGKDADVLLEKALEEDYIEEFSKDVLSSFKSKAETVYEINEEIAIKAFPETVQYIMNAKFEDGKKRALFVLLTFLFSIKWDDTHIENIIYEWNDKQPRKLKKGYIMAQLHWFRNQERVISPPNFDNENYYVGIGIPEKIIKKDSKKVGKFNINNPLQYVYFRQKKK